MSISLSIYVYIYIYIPLRRKTSTRILAAAYDVEPPNYFACFSFCSTLVSFYSYWLCFLCFFLNRVSLILLYFLLHIEPPTIRTMARCKRHLPCSHVTHNIRACRQMRAERERERERERRNQMHRRRRFFDAENAIDPDAWPRTFVCAAQSNVISHTTIIQLQCNTCVYIYIYIYTL